MDKDSSNSPPPMSTHEAYLDECHNQSFMILKELIGNAWASWDSMEASIECLVFDSVNCFMVKSKQFGTDPKNCYMEELTGKDRIAPLFNRMFTCFIFPLEATIIYCPNLLAPKFISNAKMRRMSLKIPKIVESDFTIYGATVFIHRATIRATFDPFILDAKK